MFGSFGNLLSWKLSTSPVGRSLGYGCVCYETEEAAKQAIERLNGMPSGENILEARACTHRLDERRHQSGGALL